MSPGLSGIGRGTGQPRIPKVERKTQFPQPPKGIPNPNRKPSHVSGPGEAPRGFINGNRSQEEWMFFWAMMKELGPPGESWGYQIGIGAGSATIDFVVWDRVDRLAIRIQTPYFHINTDRSRHLFDEIQRDVLKAFGYTVIDVFSEQYADDMSGEAVREICRDALAGIERPNLIAWGISISPAT